MKKLLLTLAFAHTLFIINFLYAQSQVSSDSWLTNYEEAKEISVKSGKPILMSFSGSDWCRPCIKLSKEVFENTTFRKFAENHFTLLNLDFPRLKKNRLSKEQVRHNETLAEKFNKQGQFPLVILLTAEENIILKTGYRPGGVHGFLNYLNQFIEKN